jgi:hypothetical protein
MNKIWGYNNDGNPVNKNGRRIYKKTKSEIENQIDVDIENLENIRKEKREKKLQTQREYWQEYKKAGRIKKTPEQIEATKKYLIEYQRNKQEIKKSADILNKMNDTDCNNTKCNDTDFFLYFIKTINDKPLFI